MEAEMIERVALALQLANAHAKRAAEGCANGLSDEVSDWGAYLARAAIEAMREPGEGVMVAGAKHLTGSNVAGRTYRVWKAMIDAALEPAKIPA